MARLDGDADTGDNVDMAGQAWDVALSADGNLLVSSTYDGRVNVWDTRTRRRTMVIETNGSFGMTVDISNDGKHIASGNQDGGVYVFGLDSGRLLYTLPGMNCLLYNSNRMVVDISRTH